MVVLPSPQYQVLFTDEVTPVEVAVKVTKPVVGVTALLLKLALRPQEVLGMDNTAVMVGQQFVLLLTATTE